MPLRQIHLLLVTLILGALTVQQPKGPKLPEELSEAEGQRILKEHHPKSHVEVTFKISDAHLGTALKLARESQYREAADDLNLYTELVVYADAYTRQLPKEHRKERNQCLKLIEQRLFRQTRLLEAVTMEMPSNYYQVSERAASTTKRIRLHALDDLLGGGEILKDPGAGHDEH